MEQEALFDHIDAYIWDLLSPDERQTFEKNLATDADLQAELALRRLENEALQLADKADLRSKMTEWLAEENNETAAEKTQTEAKVVSINQGRAVRFSPMRWAAAAAVALLIVVGGRFWATTNYSSATLANDFYGKSSDVLRGGDDEVFGGNGTASIDAAALLADAKTAFEAKDYDKSIANYQNILANNTVSQGDTQEAEWKLIASLMAAGKTKEPSAFKPLLEKLVNDTTHPYHKSALELNQKAQSFWWKIAN